MVAALAQFGVVPESHMHTPAVDPVWRERERELILRPALAGPGPSQARICGCVGVRAHTLTARSV